MTPDQWRQVDSLFTEAQSLSSSARAAFLDSHCPDPETRREVESLLKHATADGADLRHLVSRTAALVPGAGLIGSMLGPYRVTGLIGKGGMGEIYAAEDPRLGRQVALKLLSSSVTGNAGTVRRFQQEARAASALNHPNIVTVHDFGQSGGIYYIATELVEGRTLREIMAGEGLPMREVAAVAAQIAGALAAAHDAGIVHRDIKPENVMLRPDGYVKILDFGLAKLRPPSLPSEQSVTWSNPGMLIGTVRYMSPEQARGLEVDARSDIFSLGVVLYEWIAHRRPFEGETAAHVLVAILERAAAPLDAGVSGEWRAIIGRCLAKEAAGRYQSARELLADLRRLQQDLDAAARPSPAPRLSIELFGTLRLTYGDKPITSVNTNRLQSLLGFLALQGDAPQSREQLAFQLWPESSESQARTNLRQLIHHLRRALPAECCLLVADNHTVQWRSDPSCTIDVVQFEAAAGRAVGAANRGDSEAERRALEEAAVLYQDELLRGLYDEWLQPKREHYRQQLMQVLTRLAALLEERGEYPAAIQHAERLVAQDPLRESHHQLLIRLHAGNQDRASALRAYHQCMKVLRRELGVEPGAATRALFEQILRSDPAGVEAPGGGGELPPAGAAPVPLPLVGRKKEWDGLTGCWRQTVRGRTHLVVISGEPGIGKSRLAEEIFEWCVRDRRPVARTRCYAAQGQLAYAPIAEWLRAEPLRAACSHLPQPRLAELARVLPEILAQSPGMPRPHPLTESWERRHFYDSLNAAFAKASKPLLLLIDDLQWCDPDSFEWLHSLFRAEGVRGILVLGTVRSEETDRGHPYSRLLGELRQSGQATEFPLAPLSMEETMALAAQVTGAPLDPAALQGLFGATKGHPLFVVETLRAGLGTTDSTTPSRIHAVIAGRLSQLSAPAYELAGFAGAVGRGFSFDLLARATDWDEDSLSRALDELYQRRIIESEGEEYDFTHDRLREVAYAELTPVRRRFLHRRIARAVEELHADDLESVHSQLAAHYEAAGMAEKAIEHYRAAAAVAQQRFADTEAEAMLRRALGICRDFPPAAKRDQAELELLLTLGTALFTTHGYANAEVGETYTRALELSARLGEKTHRFNAICGSWVFHVVRGQLETSLCLARQVLDLGDGPELVVAGNFMLGSSTFQMGRFAESAGHLAQSMAAYGGPSLADLALFAGPDVRVFCQSYQAHALWMLGSPDQAIAKSDEAFALAEAAGHPFSRAIALAYRAMLHLFRHESRLALDWAERGSAVCARHDFAYYHSMCEIVAGWATAREGNVAGGLARFRQGLDRLKATGAEIRLAFYYGLFAELSAQADRPGEALAHVANGLAFQNKSGELWAASDLHRIHGDVLLANGNPAAAQASYRRAIESARQTGGRSFELRAETHLREAERLIPRPQNALRTPDMPK